MRPGDPQQSNATARWLHLIFSMKTQQGLAIITRTEHWDQAAQYSWGLSRLDIAAYLQLPLSEMPSPFATPQESAQTSSDGLAH